MPRKSKRDVENPYEKGSRSVDFRKLAETYIRSFFEDKSWFCGGPIPQRELLSDFSIKTVLRTQFDRRCFDFIHYECLPLISNTEGFKDNTVTWEVHCLLQLISELKYLGVPKEFQPGLLMLYFKFCKGQKILPPPLL